ncbi:MAG: F0F1 ATP synthase subunit epsilon [Candidatus Hatepunaea meridiana]|nr:F0F1 ATP synthase subunit epsilon [Candidatus Hatepunaea meridiana]
MAEIQDTILVTIVTPAGTRDEYNVKHIRAPGSEGDFGVLPGHLPLMTSLRIGAIYLDTVQGQQVWSTSGGYVEVLGNRVTILAETAEKADKIELERAEAARDRALGRISKKATDLDIARARLALNRAINRIKTVKESRKD